MSAETTTKTVHIQEWTMVGLLLVLADYAIKGNWTDLLPVGNAILLAGLCEGVWRAASALSSTNRTTR